MPLLKFISNAIFHHSKNVSYRRIFLLLAAISLSGCASFESPSATLAPEPEPQRELAFRSYLDAYARLNRIAFTLERASAPFCKTHLRYAGGVILADPHMAVPALSDAARAVIGGDRSIVYAVVAHSPAEAAGLEAGDIVETVDGGSVVDGLQKATTAHHETWVVRRGGERKTLGYDPVAICDFPVRLAVSDKVAAATDARRIIVTTAAVRATTDDELALILGHELAHDVLGHSGEARRLYQIMHSDPPNADRRFALETEADYVGSYLAADAGYDIRKAAALWLKLPASGEPDHPPAAERRALALATANEIDRKRASGEPLVPRGLSTDELALAANGVARR